MKKPIRPVEPYEYQYRETIERRYIYNYTQSLREEGTYDGDETETEIPEKEIKEVTLAWLLEKIPPGLTPADIKIEFDYRASSMQFESHCVKFYYEEKIPARLDEYQIAKKEYKIAYERYERDLKKFHIFLLERERQTIQNKLDRLTEDE